MNYIQHLPPLRLFTSEYCICQKAEHIQVP
jgi:hypothetical protein